MRFRNLLNFGDGGGVGSIFVWQIDVSGDLSEYPVIVVIAWQMKINRNRLDLIRALLDQIYNFLIIKEIESKPTRMKLSKKSKSSTSTSSTNGFSVQDFGLILLAIILVSATGAYLYKEYK